VKQGSAQQSQSHRHSTNTEKKETKDNVSRRREEQRELIYSQARASVEWAMHRGSLREWGM
jgi:hypothetical protein